MNQICSICQAVLPTSTPDGWSRQFSRHLGKQRIVLCRKGYRKGAFERFTHHRRAQWSGFAIERMYPLGRGMLSDSQAQVLEQ